MRAVTLTQPWASLVAMDHKRVETRAWRTHHRGQIAIHAAKGLDRVGGTTGLLELCATQPFRSALEGRSRSLPLGAFVAVAHLVECIPAEEMRDALNFGAWEADYVSTDDRRAAQIEIEFGDYRPGRWAWVLDRVRPVEPVPCRGHQGVWEVPADLLDYLREAA